MIAQAEANRRDYGRVHSVVIVDLNGLKALNDSYGHAAGDALLERAAEVLTSVTRQTDAVARIGGDEFGVLLDEPDALEAAAFVGRVRRELQGAQISAAVGCALKRPSPRCSGAASRMAINPRRKTWLCTAVRALPQFTTMRETASGNKAAQW